MPNPDDKRPNTRGKKNKQNQNNKNNANSNKQGKGNKGGNKNDNKNAEQKKQSEVHMEEAYFDEIDFPISYKNEDLSRNWYEFNDTAVNAIPVNRLQKQFGGNSGNAYILIYRKKMFNNKINDKNEMHSIPEYLRNYINDQNELVEKERIAYKEAERQIEVILLDELQVNVD